MHRHSEHGQDESICLSVSCYPIIKYRAEWGLLWAWARHETGPLKSEVKDDVYGGVQCALQRLDSDWMKNIG